MRSPSFRTKLLLALMATVASIVAATLLATQSGVATTYERIDRERFRAAVEAANRLQESRLAAVRARCRELAGSVRLIAAIEENDPALLYRIALDELRDVLRPPGEGRAATLFRLADASGRIVPSSDERAGRIGDGGEAEQALARAFDAASTDAQEVGYVDDPTANAPRLLEVVRTRIVDPVDAVARGALLVGFPVDDEAEGAGDPALLGGLWVGGRLYSHSIPAEARAAVSSRLASRLGEEDAVVDVGGVPHRLFAWPLAASRPGAPVLRVALHSMAEALAELDRLRRQVLGIGGIALLLALGTSLFLSRGLSGPIRDVVRGTEEINRGNFAVRVPVRSGDEIGRLATAFNDMAEGLAEKERIRGVLNVVADRAVAEQLVRGGVELGGELRDVSVLFCDIRGFTTLTEGMPPADVIALLNEHMSALTRVVHEHGGVVDKFAGDSLMALFGAPRAGSDDAGDAARAAVGLVEARAELNRRSGIPIEIGVGVATGAVVAGCMGASDRLNYTVIGAHVNLASRLCAVAPRGEVLADETTARRAGADFAVEPLAPLELKGYREPVPAFRVRRAGAAEKAS